MLTRLAPHLVRPVSFLYPLTHYGWERPYVGAGLMLYDAMGGAHAGAAASAPLPRGRSRARAGAEARRARRRHPLLRRAGRRRAPHADGGPDRGDVRRHGASARRRSSASLARAGASSAPSCATPRPASTVDVRVGVVVNATGVWTDDVQTTGRTRAGEFKVRASKGIHLVVPRDRISRRDRASSCAPRSRCCSSSRGATTGSSAPRTTTGSTTRRTRPRASADIDYVLDHVNRVLAVPLTRDDISGVYAGLRPLLSGEHEETSQLSREHAVSRPPRGMVSVAGGKYTTYRVMATRRRRRRRRRTSAGTCPPASPQQIPLVGADGYHALANQAEIARPRPRACRCGGWSTCSAATARCSTRCSRRPPRTRGCSSRCRAPGST